MNVRKYRWSKHYESAEEELVDYLGNKHIDAERWHANEYEVTEKQQHDTDAQFWCVEGSIIFQIDTKEITLQAGDALDVPANTLFASKAGFSGVVCYKAS